MYIEIIITAYVVLSGISSSGNAFPKEVKIIGGKTADISEFPYAVSIRYYRSNKVVCGGAIVSDKHVLTAAHCLDALDYDYAKVRVYTGSSRLTGSFGSSYLVDEAISHPEFRLGRIDNYVHRNDIAVIIVVGRIVFDRFQNKIDLPGRDVEVGAGAVVTGWGQLTNEALEASEELRMAPMTILDNEKCATMHPFSIADEQVCAYEDVDVGICQGDSGSPLVSEDKLVGLASFGLPCATGVSDIYTRIYSFLDFINFVMSFDD